MKKIVYKVFKIMFITRGRLIFAFISVFLLGFTGLLLLSSINDSTATHSTFWAGYRALQLFVLNGDLSDLAKANLYSQFAVWLAAFLAPVIGFAAIIRIYSRQFQFFLNGIISPKKEHTVICGLGSVGIEICRSLAKEKVVVVDNNPDQIWIQECLNFGIGVVIGDALDPTTMKHARMEAARTIFLVLPTDDLNLEATLKLSRYLKDNGSGSCRTTQVWSHVSKQPLIERLEHYLEFQGTQTADVRFFNLYSLTAQKFLRDHPPDAYAMIRNESLAHLVFFGFGAMARKMAVEAVKLCHFFNASRLKITVFDAKIQAKIEFLASYPGFESICDLEFIQHQFPNDLCSAHCLERIPSDATQLIVTLGNDTNSAGFALSLREHLLRRPGGNVPVFVRLKHIRGAGSLLSNETNLPDCLHPFGMLKTILGFSTDLRHEEVFAERIHTLSYLARATQSFATDHAEIKLEMHTPWDKLPHFLRESNRLVVEHLLVKLRAIRHALVEQHAPVPQDTFRPYIIPGFGQNDEEHSPLELALARTEKMRWNAERILTGWTFGPRADLARQHDNILPWEDMAADDQLRNKLDHDKDIVRNMAGIVDGGIALKIHSGTRQDIEILATDIRKSLGQYQVRPLHIIGVMASPEKNTLTIRKELVRDIEEIFDTIRRRHPKAAFVVWSTLVTPEERLAADTAMKALGADIQMVLPLYYKVLAQKFSSAINTSSSFCPSLQGLLRNADARKANPMRVFELPFRCSLAQSCVDPLAICAQYDWLASFFVHYCDELLLFQEEVSVTSDSSSFLQAGKVRNWWKQPVTIPKDFRWQFEMHLSPAGFRDQGERQEAFMITNHT